MSSAANASGQESNDPFANVFKILIATDNHIGYLEDDPVRGQDSFSSFEEILKLAQHHQVDFILLGGDLFHHNRPSRSCLYQTMSLLRRYCMGDKPSKLWIASDQSEHFHDDFTTANYLDPNLNVSYPVFSIHGNHDNPNGPGNLCSLQLLSVTGLVNYFGRAHNIQDVTVQPILMTKGTSKLALYGLGNVRDERLHRVWRDGHVQFSRPADQDWADNCFNLFVLHQNRVKHGPTSYIPEQFLDGFLDLVLWGHEHDCRIDPEQTGQPGLSITQPGSSVATSLSEGESLAKHVGLLRIDGNDYTLEKIRLSTVRPFQFTSVALNQTPVPLNDVKACQRYLQKVVEDLIVRANEEWDEQQHNRPHSDISQMSHSSNKDNSTTMPLPLIRIRVDYTGGYEIFNPLQFGQQYTNRVANPKDMLKFQRAKTTTPSSRKPRSASAVLDDMSASIPERLDQIKVEDLVNEFLCRDLGLLPENELEEAVKMFVEKDDKDAIRRFVNKSVTHFRQSIPATTDVDVLTEEFIQRRALAGKNARMEAFARDLAGIPSTNNSNGGNEVAQRQDVPTTNASVDLIEDSDDDMFGHAPPSRQRKQQGQVSVVKEPPAASRSRSRSARHDSGDGDDDDMMMIDDRRTPTPEPSRRTTTKRKQQAPAKKKDDEFDFDSDHHTSKNNDDDNDDDFSYFAPSTRTATKRQTTRPLPAPSKRGRHVTSSSRSGTRNNDGDGDMTRLHTSSTTKDKSKTTSDSISNDDNDDDDEPLFDIQHLPTQTQRRRALPSSLSR
ncbi:unnamed protein product [Absidia cylindrospora]